MDLKLANVICGLQSHASTHPSCWCEGSAAWDVKEKPRTLGSIHQYAARFNRKGRPWAGAKKNKNCIDMPLHSGEDEEKILSLIPAPELHLMLGVMNKIFGEVKKAWGNNKAHEWAQRNGIAKAEYYGRCLEGNQCRQA